jgi:hypothetical protein
MTEHFVKELQNKFLGKRISVEWVNDSEVNEWLEEHELEPSEDYDAPKAKNWKERIEGEKTNYKKVVEVNTNG